MPRDDKLWKANERLNNKLYNGITNEQKIFQAQFYLWLVIPILRLRSVQGAEESPVVV